MLANELRKGDTVMLHNGWNAKIYDNRKGNTRTAIVHGDYNEIGSIYIWNIAYAIKDGIEVPIELTEKQKKDRAMIGKLFR